MSLSNPKPADFDERLDTAVRLLCEGHAEGYIAAQLGVSGVQVRRWLKAAARARAEEREEAIERHRMQLRYLYHRYLSQRKRLDEKTQREIELPLSDRDVKTLLALMERESRLLGLDSPVRAELKHEFESQPLDELVREAQRLGIDTAALAALPAIEDAEVVDRDEVQQEELKDAI